MAIKLIKASIVSVIAAVFLFGCSAESNKYDIKSLIISPAVISVSPSGTQQFSCKALYGDDISRNYNPSWSISDSSLGAISPSGLFTAASNVSSSAEVKISAKAGNVSSFACANIDPFLFNPPAPQIISFLNIKPYSLSLSWSACAADGYIVSIGVDNNADKATFETTTNSADITSLGSSVLYYFKVRSFKTAQGNRVYSGFSPVFSITTSNYPVKYTVSGNKIVDDKNDQIVFRGVNILDPAWMDSVYNNVNDQYFSALESWKVKIIRIPVHPAAFNYYGSTNYLKLLDKALDLAAAHKIYAIIDFHSIGFAPDGTYDNLDPGGLPWTGSIYAYTDQSLISFWQVVADHYKNDDRVVFYELFNEPTNRAAATDSQSWNAWKTKAESLIDVIRGIDPKKSIIVGGINYSYDVSYAAVNPINRQNIVYGTHPYPNQAISSDTAFGNLASNYPVFAAEFGFDPNAANGIHYKADTTYGTNMINYLEGKKIGWTVWSFSSTWGPALLTDWNFNTTASGTLFKAFLQSLN